MRISGTQAVADTLEWFDRNSGWAPPDPGTIEEWLQDGSARCPDDCLVAPAGVCRHGLASWWLVLLTVDSVVPPPLMVPHPDRFDPDGPGFIAAMEAHHRAVVGGQAGYLDPETGLFVQTAATHWERGSCCNQGCRHCPYTPR